MIGLDFAHFIAAAAALVAVPLTWHWKLQPSVGIDLALSMHWPTPLVTHRFEQDQGPVLVTIEYRIEPSNRSAFLKALGGPAAQRRRDGAYAWNVFEDAAEEGRFLETFFVESWLEHLRQHQRVTNADRVLQDAVYRFHLDGEPKITHLIAAELSGSQENPG